MFFLFDIQVHASAKALGHSLRVVGPRGEARSLHTICTSMALIQRDPESLSKITWKGGPVFQIWPICGSAPGGTIPNTVIFSEYFWSCQEFARLLAVCAYPTFSPFPDCLMWAGTVSETSSFVSLWSGFCCSVCVSLVAPKSDCIWMFQNVM